MEVPESTATVTRYFTPAMLADLLDVPVSAIRHWQRRGVLVPSQVVRRLPQFDLAELVAARRLAALSHAGCSLRTIDRKLAELERMATDAGRPLTDPDLVVEGQRLLRRKGQELTEPHGQLVLDFETDCDSEAEPVVLPLQLAEPSGESTPPEGAEEVLARLHQMALDWEAAGEWSRAIDAYRGILAVEGPSAEANFALGDVFYRQGDYSAARERFYMAIELDESFVEARANLGCVLTELGEITLAVAAFEGALHLHPDYAEVHYHLANAFERLQRASEARAHWLEFLRMSPDGPWSEVARERVEGMPTHLRLAGSQES